MKNGKVYLIGAGPGSPDLITVRGREILRQAEVVIYDYLVDKDLLDEAVAATELICCDELSGGRYADGFIKHSGVVNALMVSKARQGKRVARLKNGDPFIFGRAAEEISALLKGGVEFEAVPGVTSASAAACFSGSPLTQRGKSSSVVFVTGHEAGGKLKSAVDWKAVAGCGSIALYMSAGNIRDVAGYLIACGKSADTPVAAVSGAGRITQRLVRSRLGDIAEEAKKQALKAPAIFIIGDTAANKKFDWFTRNKRILFTGLSAKRYFLKGTYFHLPLIKIGPLADYGEFDGWLGQADKFDWLVFSSRYAAEYFFLRLKSVGSDCRSLKGVNIAAIGSSTAEALLSYGINPDLVARKESSRGLLEEFKKIDIKGKMIFIPRSDLSDKGLAEGLKAQGADVCAAVAYRNMMPKGLPDLDLAFFDEIIFTSPSGVRNFAKRYGRPAKKTAIKCIGSVTAAQARKSRLL